MVKKAGLLVLILLLFLSAFLGGCDRSKKGGDASNAAKEKEKASIPSNYLACPLDGEMAPPAKLQRRIVAVTVENSPQARPQAGLLEADRVYEVLAEGGITRFLAVYLHGEPERIGPVRSARPYLLELAKEYDAVYFHAGGSDAAFAMIRQEQLPVVNEFQNGRYFWRSKDRKPPHNLYTSIAKAREAVQDKGFAGMINSFPRWSIVKDVPSMGEQAKSISLRYSADYLVGYSYNQGRKLYMRSVSGTAHRDAISGKQLSAKNIIVQFAGTKVLDNEGRLEISLIGSGKGLLFQQGMVHEVSWVKDSSSSPTCFYEQDGSQIKLLAGQTWIEVMPLGAKVQFGE